VGWKRRADELAVEEPLEIRVDTRSVAIAMRTPGHDQELVAGFLFTEGLIQQRADVVEIRPYPRNPDGNVMDAYLADGVKVDFKRLTRHVFMSSSCGLCGKATLKAIRHQFGVVRSDMVVTPGILGSLPERLFCHQETFKRTGGLHAAALFDAKGRLLVAREDIGRHNAVDKVLGFALLKGWVPLHRHILLVSGRASFEIMQKSLAGRIPVVAAVSAPSSLAVRFARESRQTLVGFVRDGKMNVYAGKGRVKG